MINVFLEMLNDSDNEGIKQHITLSDGNAEDNTVHLCTDRVQVASAADHHLLTNTQYQ